MGRRAGDRDLQPRTVIINLNPPSFTSDFVTCYFRAGFVMLFLLTGFQLLSVDDLNAGLADSFEL